MKTPRSRDVRAFAVALGSMLLAIVDTRAAWKVDPDFRPLPAFGYAVPRVTGLQADGRLFVEWTQRLNADGSSDTAFQPDTTQVLHLVSPSVGQFYGIALSGFDLLQLNETGTSTGTTISLNGQLSGIPGALPDGRFYIFGHFNTVNGVFRPNIARIHPDGSLDQTFDPGSGVPSGSGVIVRCAALAPDGKILLGGNFSSFGGIPRHQVVRLNSDGTLDLSFDPGPAIPPPPESSFSIGPQALAADTQGRVLRADRNVIRRHATDGSNPTEIGEVSYRGSPANIDEIHTLPDDAFLVFGSFDAIGSQPQPRVARFRADGSLDPALNLGRVFSALARANILVHRLPSGDCHIYVQSYESDRLVRFSSDGSLDASFELPGAARGRAGINAVVSLPSGGVYLGGRFTQIDDAPRNHLACVDRFGEIDPSFNPGSGLNGTVRALALEEDGQLLVGGSFAEARSQPRSALARFNADGSLDASFDAHFEAAAVVNAIGVQPDGAIVVGGRFASIDGTARANLARLLPDGSLDSSFVVTSGVTGNDAVVNSIEVLADGKLVVAGSFDSWNGARRWSVMRLNVDGSLDPTFDPLSSTSGTILNSVRVAPDGAVIVGGRTSTFTSTLALLEPDGELRASGAAIMPRNVTAVHVDPAHGVLAATTSWPEFGELPVQNFDTQPYSTIERFNLLGARDGGFIPELSHGAARVFATDNEGSVLVAGDFVETDGMAYVGAFRLLSDTPPPRIANISTRAYVGTNDEVLIAGFYVTGTERQRVLLRAVADNLAQLGVNGRAIDVSLQVFAANDSAPIAEVHDLYPIFELQRIAETSQRFGIFPLVVPPRGVIQDAAALFDLEPGAYTAIVRAGQPGIALVEAYEINGVGADRKLVNISTRGRVGIDDERMIAGFIVDRGTKRVLIRAMGPGLASLVGGTLADPAIELVRQSDGATLATNDNWGDATNAAEIATVSAQVTGLPLLAGSADSALLAELPPGGYTVIVSGVGQTTGIALAEVYEVP